MKRIFYILALTMLLFSADAFAQKDKDRDKPVDYVEQAVTYWKKELQLDDFQAAAVKEIMASEKDGLMALRADTSIKNHEKKDRTRIITDRIDERIIQLLTKEQAEKYKKLQKKNS